MKKLLSIILLLPFLSHGQITGCVSSAPIPPVSAPVVPDTVPTPFTFSDVTGATISTVYTASVTLSGLTGTAHARVTGGTISINGGSYVSSGTVVNGNTVAVRVTSSASYSTAVNAVVTIGGVTDTYTVTTGSAPVFNRAAAYDSVNKTFTKGFWSKDAKTDYAGTTQATHGQDILSIKETIANTGEKAVFVGNNGIPSGSFVNPITGGGFQSSTFAVPGVGVRTYPKYDTSYGGSWDMFNGRCKYMEFYQNPDKNIPIEIWLITRPKPTIVYEYELSGYGGEGWRRNTNGALLQWAGQTSEYTGPNDGTGFPKVMEINIMHFVMHGNNKMALRITNSAGDLVFQDSVDFGVGTKFLRNQYIGSNGHPDNADIYGYLEKEGELTTAQRVKCTNWIKQLYPVGQKPNKPHCIPTISVSGSGSSLTWTVIPNYNDGGTGSAMDPTATTVRWYYADQNASYSGGNWLDTQGFIRTTDANTLTLTRTLANTLTGGRYVIPGDNNTLMSVDMDCYSFASQHHKYVPSWPTYNNQP
jgi:hypothetical protein